MKPAPDIMIRVVFELRFQGKDRVNSVQNRVSQFSGSRLHAVMAEGLSGIQKHRLLVFDRVELDVGKVSFSRMEDDLAAGIARCLKRWAFSLSPSYSTSVQLSGKEALSSERNDVLPAATERSRRHYAFIPSAAGSLNAAVTAALQEPADWSEFLSALRGNHALRCRLADEVSPRLLRRLMAALVPNQGLWIADCAEEMLRLHERQPLPAVNIHVFRRALWECIFFELAGGQGASFSQRAFIHSLIRRIAGRLSRSQAEVVTNLELALQRHTPRTATSQLMLLVVNELKTTSVEKSQASFAHSELSGYALLSNTAEEKTSAAGASRRLDDLAKFLEFGVLPWGLIGRGAQAEMLDLLAATPDAVCDLVRKLGEEEPARKRLGSQFSEVATSRLLAAIAPTAAPWMISCVRQLRRIHAQKALFPIRNQQFAQELWELCFAYLAEHKWQSFNAASFLEYLLSRLAARQKISYETLLADVALRRGPESTAREAGNTSETSTSFGAVLLALLDEALLGLTRTGFELPRFLIKPEHRHRYSDLDVLAHWLRWHKLPPWSHATDPEDTGRRLGSLLRALPPEVQLYASKSSLPGATTSPSTSSAATETTAAEQMKHWLSFGIWPTTIAAADDSQLEAWLKNQSEADWLKALEAGATQEAAIARISRFPSLWERVTRMLAGNAARLVLNYLGCLNVAGQHIAPVATQVWVEQLKKYTLTYLLRASSIAGRYSISVSDLARSVMLALSLNCRVSYERLLDAVEDQSQGQDEVQKLCLTLRQELEMVETDVAGEKPIAIAPSSSDAEAPLAVSEVVLHYLKHGSLPQNLSAISFSALQQAADTLSDEQISIIASACGRSNILNPEVARRIATLFSGKNFTLFAQPLLADTSVVNELDNIMAALAPQLSAAPKLLRVAARTLLLRHVSVARTRPMAQSVLQAVLPEVIQEVASLVGVRPELIWRELSVVAKDKSLAATALSKLDQGARTGLDRGANLSAPTKADRADKSLGLNLSIPTAPDPKSISKQAPEAKLALSDSADLVLHYLQYGSLPEHASSLGFSSLQETAEHLSAEQLSGMASACCAEMTLESAHRIASLFSRENFSRFVHPLFTSTGTINDLEDALSALASRLSTPSQPLLVAARAFLLRHPASGLIGAPAESILKAVLSGCMPEIANLLGVKAELAWRELGLIVEDEKVLAKVVAELAQETGATQPQTHDNRSETPTRGTTTTGVTSHQETERITLGISPDRNRERELLLDQENTLSAPSLHAKALEASSDISQVTDEVIPSLRVDHYTTPKALNNQASDCELQTNNAPTGELHGKLAALSHFLRTGQLPWWTENLARESSRDWIAEPLRRNPKLVLETLRPLSSLPGVLPRFVRYVAKTELEAIVHAAIPESSELLLLYTYAGSKLSMGASAVQESGMSEVHWQEVLSFLLDAQSSKPSTSEALRELTSRVSGSLGLAQESYLRCLLQVAEQQSCETHAYDKLAELLVQLLPEKRGLSQRQQENPLSRGALRGRTSSGQLNSEKIETAELSNAANTDQNLLSSQVCAIRSDHNKPPSVRNATRNEDSDGTSHSETTAEFLPENHALQCLDCLLRYGYLSSETKTSHEELLAQLTEAISQYPRECCQYVQKAAKHDLERKRMARLLPSALLDRLWPLLLPAHHSTTTLFVAGIEETLSVSSTGSIGKACQEILVEELLRAIVTSQGSRWDSSAFFRSAIERLAGHLSLRPAVLIQRVRTHIEDKPEDVQKKLQTVIGRVELETVTMPRIRPARPLQPAPQAKPQPAKSSRKMLENEPFYISNAGLVLLWPFLQLYFQKLGLLENNAFRDEKAQARAIYLLQYLGTESMEAPESNLLLNKILTGAMPEQPLESPAPLTEPEQALSEQLLQGVLKNWNKLKNTSIHGLRESFLKREGKLVLKEDTWSLTVSTKGYDILLDSLPWRISLVRLPFMKSVLHVKWR